MDKSKDVWDDDAINDSLFDDVGPNKNSSKFSIFGKKEELITDLSPHFTRFRRSFWMMT